MSTLEVLKFHTLSGGRSGRRLALPRIQNGTLERVAMKKGGDTCLTEVVSPEV